MQHRDPGAGQTGLEGARELHAGHDVESFDVDIGLEEAVEQHQAIRPGLVEAQAQVSDRREVGAQLHGDRDADGLLHPAQDLEVALFDIGAHDVELARHHVDVQLQGGRTGVLHAACRVDPAAVRGAVEAGDDRDVGRVRRPLEHLQVAVGDGVTGDVVGIGEVAQRLAEGLLVALHLGDATRLLAADLLLEQRVHDHRAQAGVSHLLDAVDGLAQRARGRHQGAAQVQPHVAGRQRGGLGRRLLRRGGQGAGLGLLGLLACGRGCRHQRRHVADARVGRGDLAGRGGLVGELLVGAVEAVGLVGVSHRHPPGEHRTRTPRPGGSPGPRTRPNDARPGSVPARAGDRPPRGWCASAS